MDRKKKKGNEGGKRNREVGRERRGWRNEGLVERKSIRSVREDERGANWKKERKKPSINQSINQNHIT